MDPVVIKVRYRDLEPGINGDAVREGSRVVVYFVPGLSSRQRKAVLRRLRQAARRGQKPPLPAGQLAFALAVDRARTSVSNVAAIVRLHPAGSIVPMFGLATLIVLFLLTSVSVHILPGPTHGSRTPPAVGGARSGSFPLPADPGSSRSAIRSSSGSSRAGGIALTAGSSGAGSSASGSSGNSDPSGSGSSGGRTPGSIPVSSGSSGGTGGSVSVGNSGGAGTSSSVTVTATAAPGSGGSAGVDVTAGQARAGVSVSAGSSGIGVNVSAGNVKASFTAGTPSPSSSGTCVDIGPLGICVKL
jgi:hypothetical protein